MDWLGDRTPEKVYRTRGRAGAALVRKAALKIADELKRAGREGQGRAAMVYEERFVLISESLHRLFREKDPALPEICRILAGDQAGKEPETTAQIHARHLLVIALLQEGRGGEALEEAKILADALEGFESVYPDVLLRAEHDLARCLLQAGKPEEAVLVYEKTLRRLRETGAGGDLVLGATLLRLGRAPRAAGEEKKAAAVLAHAGKRLGRALGEGAGVVRVNCHLPDTSL